MERLAVAADDVRQYFAIDYLAILTLDADNRRFRLLLESPYTKPAATPAGTWSDGLPESQFSALRRFVEGFSDFGEVNAFPFRNLPFFDSLPTSSRGQAASRYVAAKFHRLPMFPCVLLAGRRDGLSLADLRDLDREDFHCVVDDFARVIDLIQFIEAIHAGSESLGRFLEEVAHDMRNPIQAIYWITERLKRDAPEHIRPQLTRLGAQIRRIHRLSQNVWLLEQLRHGRLEPDTRGRVHVHQVIMDAVAIRRLTEARFSVTLVGIPGLARGEEQPALGDFWFCDRDIQVAKRIHDANSGIPLAAITVTADEEARSRIRQAGVATIIQRAQPISRIADEIMRFAGIAAEGVGMPSPVAPAVERLAAVDYALTKCHDFLRSAAQYDKLCALWAVSQLAEVLDDEVVRVVLADALANTDFRIRAEGCYLAARVGIRDDKLLRPLLDDPNPAVRKAVERLDTTPSAPLKPLEIRSPANHFWTGLAIIQEKRNRIMQMRQTGVSTESRVSDTVKQAFRGWLAGHPTPEAKDFFAGSRALSARDIVSEVEQETEVGVEHVEMLMSALLTGGGSRVR
jgi:signal transduction histidine kinase